MFNLYILKCVKKHAIVHNQMRFISTGSKKARFDLSNIKSAFEIQRILNVIFDIPAKIYPFWVDIVDIGLQKYIRSNVFLAIFK